MLLKTVLMANINRATGHVYLSNCDIFFLVVREVINAKPSCWTLQDYCCYFGHTLDKLGKYSQILIFVEHSLYQNSTKIRQREKFPVQVICFIYESTPVKNTTDKQLTK